MKAIFKRVHFTWGNWTLEQINKVFSIDANRDIRTGENIHSSGLNIR